MNLIEETGFNYDLRIVHCDNQGALKIIRNEGIRKIEFLRAWEGVVISMCTIKGMWHSVVVFNTVGFKVWKRYNNDELPFYFQIVKKRIQTSYLILWLILIPFQITITEVGEHSYDIGWLYKTLIPPQSVCYVRELLYFSHWAVCLARNNPYSSLNSVSLLVKGCLRTQDRSVVKHSQSIHGKYSWNLSPTQSLAPRDLRLS